VNATDLLNNIADLVLLTALPAIVLFVFYYYTKSVWKKYTAGRTLMWLAISLGVLFSVNTASIWLGQDYPGRAPIRVAAYTFLSINVWRLFFTLRKVQKNGSEEVDLTLPLMTSEALIPGKIDPAAIPRNLTDPDED